VLLFSLEFILINLVVDVLYGVINPTIRYKYDVHFPRPCRPLPRRMPESGLA
jgi:hypothetical protein